MLARRPPLRAIETMRKLKTRCNTFSTSTIWAIAPPHSYLNQARTVPGRVRPWKRTKMNRFCSLQSIASQAKSLSFLFKPTDLFRTQVWASTKARTKSFNRATFQWAQLPANPNRIWTLVRACCVQNLTTRTKKQLKTKAKSKKKKSRAEALMSCSKLTARTKVVKIAAPTSKTSFTWSEWVARASKESRPSMKLRLSRSL